MISSPIKADEAVVRILHRDWVVDGELQISAFALRQDETYISVNRPSVDSFESDVHDFVISHPMYRIEDNGQSFRQAELQVGEIRKITVELGDISADLSVEVEPRDGRIKSHAGIFTRIKGKSLKGGHQKELVMENGRFVSYEAIQLKVQYALLSLSQLGTRQIYSQKP